MPQSMHSGQNVPSSPTNTNTTSDSCDRTLDKAHSPTLITPGVSHPVKSHQLNHNYTFGSNAMPSSMVQPLSATYNTVTSGTGEHGRPGLNNSDTGSTNAPFWGPYQSTRTSFTIVLINWFIAVISTIAVIFAINLLIAITVNATHDHDKAHGGSSDERNAHPVHLKVWLGFSIALFVISCVFLICAFCLGQKSKRPIPHEEVVIGHIGQYDTSSTARTFIGGGQPPDQVSGVSYRAVSIHSSIDAGSAFGAHRTSRISASSNTQQYNVNAFSHPRIRSNAGSSQSSLSISSNTSSGDGTSSITSPEANQQNKHRQNAAKTGPRTPNHTVTASDGSEIPLITACQEPATAQGQNLRLRSESAGSRPRSNYGITSGRALSFTSTSATEAHEIRTKLRPSLLTTTSTDTVRPKTAGYFSGVSSLADNHRRSYSGYTALNSVQQATAVQILSPGKPKSLQLNKLVREGNSHRLSRSVGDLDRLVDGSKDEKPEKDERMVEEFKIEGKGDDVRVKIMPATPTPSSSTTHSRRPESCPPLSPPISPLSPTGAVWGTPYPPEETEWVSPPMAAVSMPTLPRGAVSALDSVMKSTNPKATPSTAVPNHSQAPRPSYLAHVPRSSSLAIRGARKSTLEAFRRPSIHKDLPPLPLGSHPPTPPRERIARADVTSMHTAPLAIRPSDRGRNGALKIKSASDECTPTYNTPLTACSLPVGSPSKRSPPTRSVSDDQVATRGVRESASTLSMGLSQSARIDVGKWLVYAKEYGL